MPAPQLRDDGHAFIVRLVDALRPLADPAAVQAKAAQLLGVYLGVNRASYSEIDGDVAVVRGRYVDGVAPLPERLSLAAFGDILVGESRRGRMVAIDDVRTDPRVSAAVRAAFDAIEMRAVVSVVLIKNGKWVAGFGVDSVKPRAWTAEERELIREVAERTWAAAEQVRAEAALRESVARHRQAEDALRRSETRKAYLLRLADALRPLRDAEAICYEAACVLGEQLVAGRAYYADVDVGRDVIDVARNWTRDDVPSIAGRLQLSAFDWILQAYAHGETACVSDARTTDVIPEASRPAVLALGIGAFVVAPLVKEGRLVAALSVTERQPREWTPDEILLVEETAERTWSAVERARAEAALKRANDVLEQRVLDRTAELATSNDALEREVRERRIGESRIKALFKRLVSTQEEERRRIARDIHDQLGQQLTALRMHLDALHGRVAPDADLRTQVERTQRLAHDLDQCVDFLTWQLRPSTLDDLGLAASLRGLVRGWSERFGIAADFESSAPADMRLAPDVETNLYRLSQEALHNVVKHAGAQHVSVVLSRHEHHAMLVIEDDGRGFDASGPGQAADDAGFGLISMRERASLVGGHLEIESTPGRGTSIFVRVPIAGDA
jgi:signal transduction histidine kinase